MRKFFFAFLCSIFLLPVSENAHAFDKGNLIFPVVGDYKITSRSGLRKWPMPTKNKKPVIWPGVNITSPTNTPIVTVAEGTVFYADENGGWGNLVAIRHANGWTSYYGHLSDIRVVNGQQIKAGETLGLMGNTGRTTGRVLSFLVAKGGSLMRPLPLLIRGEVISANKNIKNYLPVSY